MPVRLRDDSSCKFQQPYDRGKPVLRMPEEGQPSNSTGAPPTSMRPLSHFDLVLGVEKQSTGVGTAKLSPTGAGKGTQAKFGWGRQCAD